MKAQGRTNRATTVALSVIVVILAGSLVFVIAMPQLVTRPITTTSTQTITATSTAAVTAGNTSTCFSPAPGQGLPVGRWFTARVNYSGSWEALAVVYDNESPIFSRCYTGNGQGFFEYLNGSLSSSATIRVTATKLDGGTGALTVAVNGNINSTNTPYGSVTVSAPVNGNTFSTTSTEATGLQRSGPISTYPAAWGLYSSCPGFSTQGNTTTLSNLSIVTYPNSWNTTTIVTLDQVYESIIGSSAFAQTASGHGWVVYSWVFDQGGSTNMPPYSNDIIGYFILTNETSPNGYVTAYYDIQNG